jgi:mRNA interferase RelE/StbE
MGTTPKSILTASRRKGAVSYAPARQYRLAFEHTARAEWDALDGSIKELLRKLLKRRLESPRVAGAQLHGELGDCYKIKLRKHGYRLVYQVIDDRLIVLAIAVGKRERDAVYQAAVKRLRDLAAVADRNRGS